VSGVTVAVWIAVLVRIANKMGLQKKKEMSIRWLLPNAYYQAGKKSYIHVNIVY
jgi:hypothetical protein